MSNRHTHTHTRTSCSQMIKSEAVKCASGFRTSQTCRLMILSGKAILLWPQSKRLTKYIPASQSRNVGVKTKHFSLPSSFSDASPFAPICPPPPFLRLIKSTDGELPTLPFDYSTAANAPFFPSHFTPSETLRGPALLLISAAAAAGGSSGGLHDLPPVARDRGTCG